MKVHIDPRKIKHLGSIGKGEHFGVDAGDKLEGSGGGDRRGGASFAGGFEPCGHLPGGELIVGWVGVVDSVAPDGIEIYVVGHSSMWWSTAMYQAKSYRLDKMDQSP